MFKSLFTCVSSVLRKSIREELCARDEEVSKNIQAELQRRALQSTADYVEAHMTHVDSVSTRLKLLDLELSRAAQPGLVCEFGVFSARR